MAQPTRDRILYRASSLADTFRVVAIAAGVLAAIAAVIAWGQEPSGPAIAIAIGVSVGLWSMSMLFCASVLDVLRVIASSTEQSPPTSSAPPRLEQDGPPGLWGPSTG